MSGHCLIIHKGPHFNSLSFIKLCSTYLVQNILINISTYVVKLQAKNYNRCAVEWYQISQKIIKSNQMDGKQDVGRRSVQTELECLSDFKSRGWCFAGCWCASKLLDKSFVRPLIFLKLRARMNIFAYLQTTPLILSHNSTLAWSLIAIWVFVSIISDLTSVTSELQIVAERHGTWVYFKYICLKLSLQNKCVLCELWLL